MPPNRVGKSLVECGIKARRAMSDGLIIMVLTPERSRQSRAIPMGDMARKSLAPGAGLSRFAPSCIITPSTAAARNFS